MRAKYDVAFVLCWVSIVKQVSLHIVGSKISLMVWPWSDHLGNLLRFSEFFGFLSAFQKLFSFEDSDTMLRAGAYYTKFWWRNHGRSSKTRKRHSRLPAVLSVLR